MYLILWFTTYPFPRSRSVLNLLNFFSISIYRENFGNLPVRCHIRPRATKVCRWLYLVCLYQKCPNYSPEFKFGPDLGITNFTWSILGKISEIHLYLAIRARPTKLCIWLYLVGIQQQSINYSSWVKFNSSPEVRSFTLAYIVKLLEIFLSLIIRAINFSPVNWSYVKK